MKILCSIIFLTGMTFSTYGQGDKDQVLQVLNQQTKCWNQGDIDCFMEGYWKSDSLMFIGSSGITSGWEATIERYRKNYPDKEAMGQLKFDILEANPVTGEVFFVVGKFYLTRTIGNLEGTFTLVFRKIEDQWKIVSDHTD